MTRLTLLAVAAPLLVLAGCRPSDAAPAGELRAGVQDSIVIPPRGAPSQLEIASWNVEWFGAPRNGPADDVLQVARVRDVIRGTDADIWGLVEIADDRAWRTLLGGLPGYSGVLASDTQVTGGPLAYGRGEQKVGVVFKSDVVTVTGARIILAHADASFAGRPPLEVGVRVSAGGTTDSLVVIVIHMKAFADEASRLRRESAARELKRYLDRVHASGPVIVIGDWNDDVDDSIVPRRPTPFAVFLADTSRYRFVTRPLSLRRVSSTTGYRELVDHHLASDEMASREVSSSVEVYRVDEFIPAFARTVSDHFPVISHYRPGMRAGRP